MISMKSGSAIAVVSCQSEGSMQVSSHLEIRRLAYHVAEKNRRPYYC